MTTFNLLPVAAAAALVLTGSALAGDIPPIDTKAKKPDAAMISPANVRLDGKEAHGVRLADEWKKRPDRPHRSADGSVTYVFGATLPTLVCTPLEVCIIRLQAGEIVKDLHTGDAARWKISPASSGGGKDGETTHIVVKPVDAGLVTNLFITTNRRSYTIKLTSTQKDWMPVLAFDYPDDPASEWNAYRQANQYYAATLPTGENVAGLDFNFRLGGDDAPWRPQRVYSDGRKTYIQFASADFGGEAPALVALGDDGFWPFTKPAEQLVNYRVIGDRYVVDKVIGKAALITGVGFDQVRVTIERGE